MNQILEDFIKNNPQRVCLILELKEGHDRQDTIIEIGIAKASSLKGRVRRLERTKQPIPDLVDLCQTSRKQLRGGIL